MQEVVEVLQPGPLGVRIQLPLYLVKGLVQAEQGISVRGSDLLICSLVWPQNLYLLHQLPAQSYLAFAANPPAEESLS